MRLSDGEYPRGTVKTFSRFIGFLRVFSVSNSCAIAGIWQEVFEVLYDIFLAGDFLFFSVPEEC